LEKVEESQLGLAAAKGSVKVTELGLALGLVWEEVHEESGVWRKRERAARTGLSSAR